MLGAFKIVDAWIESNYEKLLTLAEGEYQFTEYDLFDFVNRFKPTEDLNLITIRLFRKSSVVVLSHCINKRLGIKQFKKGIKRLAEFSALNEYANEVFPDELYNGYPFDLVEWLLEK
ncbi:TPA: hypothetical protein ACGO1T_001597 [Streptococcus suis]